MLLSLVPVKGVVLSLEQVKALGYWPKETRPTGAKQGEHYGLVMKECELAMGLRWYPLAPVQRN